MILRRAQPEEYAAAGELTEQGCAAIVLSTLDLTHGAHRLYERMGFRRRPERDWNPEPDITLVAYVLDLEQ